MHRWLMSLSGVDFGEEEGKKENCMPVSVRTHRERNALNAPEDAFNGRYKLSIFPCRKTQSPFMGTEATCDNSRGLCWINRQQTYLTYLHTSDQSSAFLPYLGTDRPTDLIMFKMTVAMCSLLFSLNPPLTVFLRFPWRRPNFSPTRWNLKDLVIFWVKWSRRSPLNLPTFHTDTVLFPCINKRHILQHTGLRATVYRHRQCKCRAKNNKDEFYGRRRLLRFILLAESLRGNVWFISKALFFPPLT